MITEISNIYRVQDMYDDAALSIGVLCRPLLKDVYEVLAFKTRVILLWLVFLKGLG